MPDPNNPPARRLQFKLDGVPYNVGWNQPNDPTNDDFAALANTLRPTVEHKNAALSFNAPQLPPNISGGDVAAYRAKWFGDPDQATSDPARLLATVARLPLSARDAAIPPAYSGIGRAALLQEAYHTNPAQPQTAQYLANKNLADLGISPDQARSQGIPQAIAQNTTTRNNLMAERKTLTAGPMSMGSGPGATMPYVSPGSIFTHDPAQAAQNAARLRQVDAQLAAFGQPQSPPILTPELGGGLNQAVSSFISGQPLAQADPSATGAALDRLYGPGMNAALQQMKGFAPGLTRGVVGFAEPDNLALMAEAAPLSAIPGAGKLVLGAFGAQAAKGAYQEAQQGDYGGALGGLAAFALPFAFHGISAHETNKTLVRVANGEIPLPPKMATMFEKQNNLAPGYFKANPELGQQFAQQITKPPLLGRDYAPINTNDAGLQQMLGQPLDTPAANTAAAPVDLSAAPLTTDPAALPPADPAASQPVQAPSLLPDAARRAPTETADAYQSAIDARLLDLENHGVDTTRLFDPHDPRRAALHDTPGWTPLPSDIGELYRLRNAAAQTDTPGARPVPDQSAGIAAPADPAAAVAPTDTALPAPTDTATTALIAANPNADSVAHTNTDNAAQREAESNQTHFELETQGYKRVAHAFDRSLYVNGDEGIYRDANGNQTRAFFPDAYDMFKNALRGDELARRKGHADAARSQAEAMGYQLVSETEDGAQLYRDGTKGVFRTSDDPRSLPEPTPFDYASEQYDKHNAAVESIKEYQTRRDAVPRTEIEARRAAYESANAARTLGAQQVYRVDSAERLPSEDKPHGYYMSIGDPSTSPHLDLADEGANTIHRGIATGKNVLNVDPTTLEHARFGSRKAGVGSGGISALKALTSDAEFNRLRVMKKQPLIAELNERFPGPDYTRYHDSYELLETYAAQLARARGYDAIQMHEPSAPHFSEYIALHPDAVKITHTETNPAYAPQTTSAGGNHGKIKQEGANNGSDTNQTNPGTAKTSRPGNGEGRTANRGGELLARPQPRTGQKGSDSNAKAVEDVNNASKETYPGTDRSGGPHARETQAGHQNENTQPRQQPRAEQKGSDIDGKAVEGANNGSKAIHTGTDRTGTPGDRETQAGQQNEKSQPRQQPRAGQKVADGDAGYEPPREQLAGTQAEGVVDPDFYDAYTRSTQHGWNIKTDGVYAAGDMFEGDAQERLQRHLSPETLQTPVAFSSGMPDDALGTVEDFPSEISPSGKIILLNSRILVDPEQFAHTAAEEMIHVERFVRGREFDLISDYKDQSHEQSARRGTPYYTGFERPNRYGRVLQEHPDAPGTVGNLTVPQSRLDETGAADALAQRRADAAQTKADLGKLGWSLEGETEDGTQLFRRGAKGILRSEDGSQETLSFKAARAKFDGSGDNQADAPKVTGKGGKAGASRALVDNTDTNGGLQSTIVPGAKEFVEQDVAPAVAAIKAGVSKVSDEMEQLLSPATRTPEAGYMARAIREGAADMAQRWETARETFKTAKKVFDKMSEPARLAFIDAVETGKPQTTPELQKFADLLAKALSDRVTEIQGFGKGYLENVVKDYFPHLWEDPKQAGGVLARILSRRPLEGSKSFMKQRSIPTTKDGMSWRVYDADGTLSSVHPDEASAQSAAQRIVKGRVASPLVPVSTNPVELTLLKIREMDKFIMGHKVLEELKHTNAGVDENGRPVNLVRYVRATERPPEGWTKLDDKAATVYGGTTVNVKEAFDQGVYDKINRLVAILDKTSPLSDTRSTAIGGNNAWGLAAEDGSAIKTKTGGDLAIKIHELGHVLDARYNVWDWLQKKDGSVRVQGTPGARVKIGGELRDLADLRFEGQMPSDGYKGYVRTKSEKIANALTAYIYAPERMSEVAPTVKARLDRLIAANPELSLLKDIKPSLVTGERTDTQDVGGLILRGHYYAPDAAAKVFNNYLSPGLRGKGWYDGLRGAGNMMNQAQLGFSAFHFTFTAMDSAVSKFALGVEQLGAGKFKDAGKSFAGTAVAPITNYLRGAKLLTAYANAEFLKANPQLAPLVDGIIKGGGRIKMDDFYHTSAAQGMWDAFKAGNYPGAAIRAPFAAIETFSKPIMEVIVPRMKLGIFSDLAQFELARLPQDATPDQTRQVMGRVWDSVDNRMGQMVYDNLFWSRASKDFAMIATRSVGWNLGTIREIGGGIGDTLTLPQRAVFNKAEAAKAKAAGESYVPQPLLTHRMAYTMALPIVVGITGAMMQYAMTGQAPMDWKDYYYPKTGRTRPDGKPERVQIASYMKDVFAYGQHPLTTIGHKVNPLVSTVIDMLNNKDFYGDQIRNEDDPLVQQTLQEAGFVAKQYLPFSATQSMRAQDRRTALLSGVGITPAPADTDRSDAEKMLYDLHARQQPAAGRTPEQAQTADAKRAIRQAVQTGGDVQAARSAATQQGVLTGQQASKTAQQARSPYAISMLKTLSAADAVKVYAAATDAEKKAWKKTVLMKVQSYTKTHGANTPLMEKARAAGVLPTR